MKTSPGKYFLVFMLLISIHSSFSQCFDSTKYYQPGEKLTYEVAYNWGFLWVDAGEVYFRVDTIQHENVLCYFFDSYGESYKFYDWIYKVRDHYKAVVSYSTFEPVWFTRNTSEGGSTVNNRYEFYPKENKVFASIQHNDAEVINDTLEYSSCTFDVLSAIYYTRSLDIASFNVGDKIPVKFIIDGEFYELYIRYLGTELKKNRDGKTYDCLKFSAMLVEGTIFKGGEDLLVWVTNDENKVPIMVEAKILIGSIKAYLTGWENLKEGFNSIMIE